MQGKSSAKSTQPKRTRAAQGKQYGYVIEWQGHYGWVEPEQEITHAEAYKHGGRVYVQAADVKGSVALYCGARVSFYAYADGDGIGGEQVKFESEAVDEDISQDSANPLLSSVRLPGAPPAHIPGMPPPPKSKPKKAKESATTSATAWLASSAANDSLNKPPKAVQPRGVAAQVASLAAAGNSSSSRSGIAGNISKCAQGERSEGVLGISGHASSGDRLEVGQGNYSVAASLKERSRGTPSACYPPAPPCPAPPPVPNYMHSPQQFSQTNLACPSSTQGSREKWWQALDDSCPISLELISDLELEPFGLVGSTAEGAEAPSEGVWGYRATKALKEGSLGAIHWFDGMFLASFLVSSSQFIDVVSRRPLTRGECVSLDNYLSANKLPAVHVADAYDLCQSISNRQCTGSESGNQDRITALEREAASMLRSLFDFRSSSRVQPPPPPPRTSLPSCAPPPPAASSRVGPRTGLGGGRDAMHFGGEADIEIPESGRLGTTSTAQASLASQVYQQRDIHSEGGLRVVDDSEFDEVNATFVEEPAESSDPTLAEAMAQGRGGKRKAPRAPRNPRVGTGQKEQQDVAQVSFSLSAGRGRASGEQGRGRGIGSRACSSTSPAPGNDVMPACEMWVPEWASFELHQRLLAEIESVQKKFGQVFDLATPQVKAHLEDCVRMQCVNDMPDPLEFEIVHHLGGFPGGEECIVRISLPPYYPVHSAVVSLRFVDVSAASTRGIALERLQQVLRSEVLAPLEGTEVIFKALDWLSRQGLMQLARLERELLDEQQPTLCGSAEAFGPVLSKSERIQENKKDRLNSKYSSEWAICYAFKNHGRCNDKDCPWSHGPS